MKQIKEIIINEVLKIHKKSFASPNSLTDDDVNNLKKLAETHKVLLANPGLGDEKEEINYEQFNEGDLLDALNETEDSGKESIQKRRKGNPKPNKGN